MRIITTLLTCVALASLAPGCSVASEWCEKACACSDCSDRDYDQCIITREAEEDRAGVYGCTDQYYAYHDCVMANNNCTLDIFSAELECTTDEYVDLVECIDSGSSLF